MLTTRRQIISGVAAATVLASTPHAKASTNALNGSDARLEELFRAWQEAEADYCRVCDHWADLSPSDPQEPQADAERSAANERAGDALLALSAVSAAGLHGVLIKLQAWEDGGGLDGDTTVAGHAVLESALADLRRLAGRTQS